MKKYVFAIAAAFVLATVSAVLILPNYWTTTLYDPAKTNLVVEGDIIQEKDSPIVENGEILFPIETVRKYIDQKVYWDEKAGKVVFTTRDKVVIMKTDKLTAMVNARPVDLNMPVKLQNSIPYIPVNITEDLFDIELDWFEENNVVVLDYKKSVVQIAETIYENARIRQKPSRFSPVLEDSMKAGEKLRVFEEYDKWYKVRTEKGLIGYMEKRHLKVSLKSTGSMAAEPGTAVTDWRPEKGKVNLAWEYVGSKTPDISKLKAVEGLDVLSPTWFNIVDKEGTVANKASGAYADWAHMNGYKIWALVGNGFEPDVTHEFLNNTDTREKIIQQLLIYAKLYKLDGINIDFENIYLKDRDMLTQFMREMTPLMKEQGLTVSIDVTFRSSSENWSMCYDREALAEVVDYMAVMAYDQHWASSPQAGSVAQLGWVENGIRRMLEQVPNEKLLLGLPFYTRKWKEEQIDGKTIVSSKAISMGAANRILKDKKPEIVWDDESGQHYAEYIEGNAIYKIWLEDKSSINLKSSLIHKYDLAGAAGWRKGFETEDIWVVLNENLKERQNYTQWANANNLSDVVFE